MSPSSKIKELRQSLKLSQQTFADTLGISRGYLKDIEVERCDPSFNFLRTLSDTYNINLNWIMRGEGEIYQPQLLEPKGENKLCGIIEQLSSEQQQIMLSIAEEFTKINAMRDK